MLKRRGAFFLIAGLLGGQLVVGAAAKGPPAVTKTADAVYIPPYAEVAASLINPPANAAVSHDLLRTAWPSADGRSIFSASRNTRDAVWAAPDRLLTTRGKVGRIVFAPDGRSIAYENPRTWLDKGAENDAWSFIAVYDFATRRITFVDPSFDLDTDPAWSADGGSVTFTRSVPGLPDKRLTKLVTRLSLGDWQPPAKRPDESFTMAAVLAAPYLYPPTGSDDGTAIAYVSREAMDRSLYFLRDGEAARRLVNYGGDDGQELSESPAVSLHGGAIAYVRGSYPNRQGDHADPVPRAELPQQQVWIIGSDGSDSPRLLGPGARPMFTPDERFVVWAFDKTIMAAALTWTNGRLTGVGAPEPFLSGDRRDMRFSPDGTKLAYVRGDGVEVYDFVSRTAAAVPHGRDVDAGPIWSPDSKSIAFRREPADAPGLTRNSCGQTRYCGPVVSKTPWSIWTAEASRLAEPKQVWQAKPGPGSAFYALDQNYAPGMKGAQMAWTRGNRIVFAWEGDGWRHLYAVPATGGRARLLTPGAGEVEYFSAAKDAQTMVYATNIGDLGRRHIARVAADGASAPVTVTRGEGNQWDPVPMADGKIAYVDSDWSHPAHIVVSSADGTVTRAVLPATPADFPGDLLVKPQLVEFPASDGRKAYGQLFVPKNPSGCAIIFSHGGIRRQMLTSFHYMDAYNYLYGMNQYLAGRGCVVLSVEYRSSIMRGFDFRNPPGWGFAGNSEIRDFIGAAKWLKARKDVDAATGVGIYGLSWGGYMTAVALAKHSDIFSVGFDMAGVHFTGDAKGMAYTPIGMIDGWKSPIFLAQGDDDMNVNFNDGIALSRALQLRRPGVEFKQRVLPGQTHDLYLTFEQLVQIYTEGSDWLISHLKAK